MNRTRYSLALCFVILAAGCGQQNASTPSAPAAAQPAVVAPAQPTASEPELKMEDVIIGTGTVAVVGKNVTIQHTGWLPDGTKFDSSKDREQIVSFLLGGRAVIKGWDQGVVGMKVGGIRKLTVPPEFGYGAMGSPGVVPPNATLVFEVELLRVN